MTLVNDKAVFEVNVKGENTGKVYSGKFIIKLHLTMSQRSRAAVEYSKRDFGNDLDAGVSNVNRLICELQVLAEEFPDWFKGDAVWDLMDFEPLLAIKAELEKAQQEFSEKVNA